MNNTIIIRDNTAEIIKFEFGNSFGLGQDPTVIENQLKSQLGNIQIINAARAVEKKIDRRSMVFDGSFIKEIDKVSIEAVRASLWDLSQDGHVRKYFLQVHIDFLANYIAHNIDFHRYIIELNGGKIQLTELPPLLQRWADDSEDVDVDIGYMVAISLYIGCQFGKALAKLSEIICSGSAKSYVYTLAGEAALNIGQYSVALKYSNIGQEMEEQRNDYDPTRAAIRIQNIAACHEALLDPEEAKRYYHKAMEILPRSNKLVDNLTLALIKNNLAYSCITSLGVHWQAADVERIRTLLEEALELRRRFYDNPVNEARVILNLAQLEKINCNYIDYENLIDEAAAVLDRIESSHILLAYVENARGNLAFDVKRYDDAIRHFVSAKRVLIKHHAQDSEMSVLTSYSLAQAYEASGDPTAKKRLIDVHRLALKTFDKIDHPIIKMIASDIDTTED